MHQKTSTKHAETVKAWEWLYADFHRIKVSVSTFMF